MTWWQAVVLGLVEGLTEYLPVSSTGHLILVQRMMGLEGPAANAYAICIQGGAILAVLGLYRTRVRQAVIGWLGVCGIGSGDTAGFRLGRNLILAFLPAAVFGLLFDDMIEKWLFGLWPIVVAWLVGGAAIMATVRLQSRSRSTEPTAPGRDLESLTPTQAVLIGLVQCLAMWPGTSRSLVTILGGVVLGLSVGAAVEFSFLLGVITLLAATVYKAIDAGPVMLDAYGWAPMLAGSVAAWLSAVVAIKWMVGYLRRHSMAVFGYYRIALAVAVGTALLAGALSNISAGTAP